MNATEQALARRLVAMAAERGEALAAAEARIAEAMRKVCCTACGQPLPGKGGNAPAREDWLAQRRLKAELRAIDAIAELLMEGGE